MEEAASIYEELAANTLNKQLSTADKEWFSSLWLESGAYIPWL
jgi:hypothetical protein